MWLDVTDQEEAKVTDLSIFRVESSVQFYIRTV